MTPADTRILLVSPDLMATSRIAALARECAATVETVRALDSPPAGLAGGYAVVLLDLQALPGDPAILVTQTHALLAALPPTGESAVPNGRQTPLLVAFGPHVHRQRLDDARAAGADEVLSRGELLGGFAACIRRWCG
jgi:hypothetical protein